ncbi:hypothetical protein EV177_005529 [Coemansia sp. RSA 1804]|nr:hypothetical protein EV177_005529 [Coemansia sp. RSA 1804]
MGINDIQLPHRIAVVLAGIYLAAVVCNWTNVKYALKPAVTLLLALPTARGPSHAVFVGLLLSALGDTFLMLPDQESMFVPGLLSFLVAHILYLNGFNATLRSGGVSWIVAAPLGAFVSAMAAALYDGVARVEDTGVQVGVVVYILTIALMTYKAAMTQTPLLVIGSLLFCVSDSILAWDKFVASYSWCELGIMATYYAAQLCIAMAHVPK